SDRSTVPFDGDLFSIENKRKEATAVISCYAKQLARCIKWVDKDRRLNRTRNVGIKVKCFYDISEISNKLRHNLSHVVQLGRQHRLPCTQTRSSHAYQLVMQIVKIILTVGLLHCH
ncbi:Uncharacterized protein APZ42_008025, partial [Daphnia magna]